jgi:hypothetical protein
MKQGHPALSEGRQIPEAKVADPYSMHATTRIPLRSTVDRNPVRFSVRQGVFAAYRYTDKPSQKMNVGPDSSVFRDTAAEAS